MYGKMSIDNVIEATERTSDQASDIVVSTPSLSCTCGDSGYSLYVPGFAQTVPLGISEIAINQMVHYLKISGFHGHLTREGHYDMIEWNLNRLMERQSGTQRMIREHNGSARAFLSSRYHILDNFDVLLSALKGIQDVCGKAYEVVSCDVSSDYKMFLKVTFPSTRVAVDVGDIVESGVVISNSEVGHGSTQVRGFVNRLICTNGMVSPLETVKTARRHTGRLHDEGAVWASDKTRQLQNQVFLSSMKDAIALHADPGEFDKLTRLMKDSTRRGITVDPSMLLRRVNRRNVFTSTESDIILTRLLQSDCKTQWDLTNAVTEASKNSPTYEDATRMEERGGKTLLIGDSEWDWLNRPIDDVDLEAQRKEEKNLALA